MSRTRRAGAKNLMSHAAVPAHDSAFATEKKKPDDLLAPLRERARTSEGLTETTLAEFVSRGQRYAIPRFHFAGPDAGQEPIRLGLFAGVHGDEPAGVAALVRFLQNVIAEPDRALGYEFFVYPLVNPTGYAAGTRSNHAGKDLNREFWRGSREAEVGCLEAELREKNFDGLITLHADDTCEGLYGYSHGHEMDELLLRPALLAAERVLPRDVRAVIDGFAAREGLIEECFQGVLSPPPEQTPRPFNLIFETPALAPFDHQVLANVAALDAIMAHYRGFIAYAQGL
jgi:protein MpaA